MPGWWSRKPTESEWEDSEKGTKKRITRSVVRKRRRSRRKKWIKRGLAAAGLAYVGYKMYHAPQPSPLPTALQPNFMLDNLNRVIEPLRERDPIPFAILNRKLAGLSGHAQFGERSLKLIFGGDGHRKEDLAIQLANAVTQNVLVIPCNTFQGNLKQAVMKFVASHYRQPNVVVLLGIEDLPTLSNSLAGIAAIETLFEQSVVKTVGLQADMTHTFFFMTTNIAGKIQASTEEAAQRMLRKPLEDWLGERPAFVARIGYDSYVPFVG